MNKQLDKFLKTYVCGCSDVECSHRIKAGKALLKYMESKAPKLKPKTVVRYEGTKIPADRFYPPEDRGFNEAIKQYKSNLRGGE